jgi:surface antigen
MRTSKPLLRSGPVAAAAVLALTPAGPAAAAGISVSTTGSTVSVSTSSCTQVNGHWGTASLLGSGQTSFSQGRQVALSGSASGQSAAWSNVAPGTYTVVVVCSNGSTAGTQSVVVSTAPSPSVSPTASPSRGVMGGIGGGSTDYGTVTLVAGGALVGTGVAATAWYLRRRGTPRHL